MANPIKLKAILDTSELKGQLQAAMKDATNGNFSGAVVALNGIGDASRGIDTIWSGINRSLFTFTTGLYTVERIASGLKSAFLSPYEIITRSTEASEKFRQSLAGTVMNARAVASAVDRFSTSPNSSIDMANMRRAAESFTHDSSLAGQLSLQSPDAAAATMEKLGTLIERFQVALPEENATAIQRALESVLEGGSGGRGLRTLRIDKSDIAQLLGAGQHGPGDMFNALQSLMRQRVPDSVLAERAGLPSNQLQHVRDDWERLLASIGNDSNLLSSVSTKFREIGESIDTYILSPQWASRARAIGDDLGRIAGNVLDAGAALLQHASGASSRANTPDSVAQQVEQLVHSLASGSDALVPVAGRAGDALHGLTAALQTFLHGITLASEDIQERAARFDNRSSLSSYLSPGSYIAQTNARSEALIALTGRLAGKPVLNADPMDALEATKRLSAGEPFLKQMFYRIPQGWIAGLDGNPQVTGIKANGAWADFASDAASQIVSGGYATQNGRFVSEGRITDSILMPLAKKYGLTLNQASGNASTTQSAPSAEDTVMRDGARMYSELGIDADLASGNPYLSRFAGVNRGISSLGDGLEKVDKAGEILERAANALDTVFAKFSIGHGEPADTFFGNLPRYQRYRIDALNEDKQGFTDVVRRFGASSAAGQDAQAKADAIQADISLLTSKLDSTLQDAMRRLSEGAGKFNVQYIDAMKSADPLTKDAVIQRVLSGNSDVARRIVSAQYPNGIIPAGASGKLGFDAIPAEFQPGVLNDAIDARMAAIKLRGQYSGTTEATSLFGPGIASQQLQFLQGMLPTLQSQASKAQDAYYSNPSDETFTTMQKTAAAVEKVKAEMGQLQVASNAALKDFLDWGKASTDAVEHGLGSALYDVISGTQKVSAAFRQMAQEILQSFSQMAVKSAFSQIPGSAGTGTQGGWLGALLQYMHILPGGPSGGGASAGGAPGYSSSGGDFTAANGTVWMPSFSEGGISRAPQILVGERRDRVPEAIVPMLGPGGTIPLGMDANGPHAILPSGQRINASFVGGGVRGFADGGIWGSASSHVGGGGLAVHNYVVSSEAEAKAHAASQVLTERDVVNIISRDLLKGGATARSVQRMGGK